MYNQFIDLCNQGRREMGSERLESSKLGVFQVWRVPNFKYSTFRAFQIWDIPGSKHFQFEMFQLWNKSSGLAQMNSIRVRGGPACNNSDHIKNEYVVIQK